MEARKNLSDKDDTQNQSTNKINNFLQKHNESNHQKVKIEEDRPAIINDSSDQEPFHTKSYRPDKPPTFTEDQMQKFAENAKYIRTDGHNLRFDERWQMYFYLPKDHPEYKDHPEDVEESNNYSSRSCTIL